MHEQLACHLKGVMIIPRHLLGEQLPENDTKGVDISCCAELLQGYHLQTDCPLARAAVHSGKLLTSRRLTVKQPVNASRHVEGPAEKPVSRVDSAVCLGTK